MGVFIEEVDDSLIHGRGDLPEVRNFPRTVYAMEKIRMINSLLAFLVEIAMLVLLGYWGYHTSDDNVFKYILAIATPAGAAVLWGIFAAPRSKTRLRQPLLLIFKLVLFMITAFLVYRLGRVNAAAIFIFFALLNQAVTAIVGEYKPWK